MLKLARPLIVYSLPHTSSLPSPSFLTFPSNTGKSFTNLATTLWVGGIPSHTTLPAGVPATVFSSFQGCLFDLAYTNDDVPPRLLDPILATENRYHNVPNQTKTAYMYVASCMHGCHIVYICCNFCAHVWPLLRQVNTRSERGYTYIQETTWCRHKYTLVTHNYFSLLVALCVNASSKNKALCTIKCGELPKLHKSWLKLVHPLWRNA